MSDMWYWVLAIVGYIVTAPIRLFKKIFKIGE